MRHYHAEQFTPRTACSGKDCACATTAMDVFFGTRGAVEMDHEDVRHQSGISCVPGKDTPSGGIDIPAIIRVCRSKGVDIDFDNYDRRTLTQIRTAAGTYFGCHLMGMYANVDAPWRAKGSTFQGGHSVFAHDYREDMPDSHYGKVQPTYCWHDPLRPRPIRVPAVVVAEYTQTASALRGLAGFVRIPLPSGARYAKPMLDRTRTDYATVAVHRDRTTGRASTVRVIKPKGRLVELAMYAEGERYRGSTTWGALSLLGNEWVHVKRLDHVGGPT